MNITRVIRTHLKPLKLLFFSVIGTLIVASLSLSDVLNRQVRYVNEGKFMHEYQEKFDKADVLPNVLLAPTVNMITKSFGQRTSYKRKSVVNEQVILPNNREKFLSSGTFHEKLRFNAKLQKGVSNESGKEKDAAYSDSGQNNGRKGMGEKSSTGTDQHAIHVKLPAIWKVGSTGLATVFRIDNDFKFTLWNFTSKITSKDRLVSKKYNNQTVYDYFKSGYATGNSLVGQYIKDSVSVCNGKFIGYAHLFAEMTNVLVDPAWGYGKVGGENLSDVMHQSVDNEYYDLYKGYFKLPCARKIDHLFSREDHLWEWTEAIKVNRKYKFCNICKRESTAVFVKRYEYANLYHTMTDLYNAFLMHVAFHLDPDSTNIVLVDGHPKGGLDPVWHTLFGKVTKTGQIKEPTVFKKLIWSMMGDNSPISDFHVKWDSVPFPEEFRHFFITRHGVSPYRKLDCANVTVSLIWRRDYVAHPRNPSGKVQRKIKNEEEIIHTLKRAFPSYLIRGVSLDTLSMKQQLQYITETDILIGMHGAGMTHALFLQKHAAVVELMRNTGMLHFWAFAKWRRLTHASWLDEAGPDEDGFHYIPPKLLVGIVKHLSSALCTSSR